MIGLRDRHRMGVTVALGTEHLRPIDMKIADASDEDLEEILRLRKKVLYEPDRIRFVKGLYYIAAADNAYSEEEKKLVEGSACAFGINKEELDEILQELDEEPESVLESLASVSTKTLRNQLFEEMATLSYLKGYQLSSEDEAMGKAAKALGINPDKAEKTMYELYMRAQGHEVSSGLFPKAVFGIGAIAAGATICALTAGALTPIIGGLVGGLQGLHGIAAVNAGLAALGGGAVAAGGGGVAGGAAAVVAAGGVLGGAAGAFGVSVKGCIDAAHDKKKLEAAIKKQQRDGMVEQEIIKNLMQAIEVQQERLKNLEAAHASKRDVACVELELANLKAKKAELELSERT